MPRGVREVHSGIRIPWPTQAEKITKFLGEICLVD
jgi:hypothetical protein